MPKPGKDCFKKLTIGPLLDWSTIIEYDFYIQRFGTQDQLDPSWLSLKAANNVPIRVEEVLWMRVQIFDQVVE